MEMLYGDNKMLTTNKACNVPFSDILFDVQSACVVWIIQNNTPKNNNIVNLFILFVFCINLDICNLKIV